MRDHDSSAEYRGAERMMLLTRGRSAAGFAVAIGIVLLRILLRTGDERDEAAPPVPPPPVPQSALVAEQKPQAKDSLEPVLSNFRSQGYRVTVHPLIGAIEMRATAYADPTKVKSARVERKGTQSEDELRCAGELAKQLGLSVN